LAYAEINKLLRFARNDGVAGFLRLPPSLMVKSERALRAGGGSAKSETVGMLGFFKKRF
jgi:hypothetical protein